MDPEVLEDQNVVEISYDTSEQGQQLAVETEAVQSQAHSNGNDVSAAVESSLSSVQDDAPKKSYASIVSPVQDFCLASICIELSLNFSICSCRLK